jgi:hypothetical protein
MSESPKQQPEQLKRFSDFAQDGPLDGDKMRIEEIIGREIIIRNYRIKSSRFQDNSSKYLTIQFSFQGDEKRYIVFTGSAVIADQLERNADGNMPFFATIRRIGKYFSLT